MGRFFSGFLELQYPIFSERKVGCFLLQQVHPYSNKKALCLTLIGYQGGGGEGERVGGGEGVVVLSWCYYCTYNNNCDRVILSNINYNLHSIYKFIQLLIAFTFYHYNYRLLTTVADYSIANSCNLERKIWFAYGI